MPWLRQLFAGLLPRRSGFSPGSFRVRFMVEEWHLDRFLYEQLCFSLSVSFHQCCILIVTYMLLLPKGRTVKAGEPSRKAMLFRKPESVRKCFSTPAPKKALPWIRLATAKARSGPFHRTKLVNKVPLGQVYVLLTSVFPCQYLPISAPYSCQSTCCW